MLAPVAHDDAYRVAYHARFDQFNADAANGLLNNDVGTNLSPQVVDVPPYAGVGLGADGSFWFSVQAFGGEWTTKSFTYLVDDGTETSQPASVALTVNQPPSITGPIAPLEVGYRNGVVEGDIITSDIELDALTISVISQPTLGFVNIDQDGHFVYYTSASASTWGPDSFIVQVSDGLDSSTVPVYLNLVNRAPITTPGSLTIGRNDTVLNHPVGVSDPDGDVLSFELLTGPTRGTFEFSNAGTFNYIGDHSYVGSESFSYRVSDGETFVNEVFTLVLTNPSTPITMSDDFLVAAGVSLTVNAPGVLGNDSDADGDGISAQLVTSPTHGTVILNGDGSFTYSPNAGYSGAEAFSYRSTDGNRNGNTVLVNLEVNSVPSAGNDAYVFAQQVFSVDSTHGLLANDSDPDGPNPLTIYLVQMPEHGSLTMQTNGAFEYVPESTFVGEDVFTYYVTDGLFDGNTATVSLAVSPDTPPVANDDNFIAVPDIVKWIGTAALMSNDSDADLGDSIQFVSVANGVGGAVTAIGTSIKFEPEQGFVGDATFTYVIRDSIGMTSEATVTVTVGNQQPVANPDVATTTHDQVVDVSVAGNDEVMPGRHKVISIDTEDPVVGGSISLNPDGTIRFVPSTGYVGTASFVYHLTDSVGLTAVGSVTVDVTNTAPVAGNVGTVYTRNHTFTFAELIANSEDADGDPLGVGVYLIGNPWWSETLVTAESPFAFTAPDQFSGLITYGLRLYDGITYSDAVLSIYVNAAPVVVADATFNIGAIDEDTIDSTGFTVDQLLNASVDGQPVWSDADAGALRGIAVVDLAGNGVWQYRIGQAGDWTDFGVVGTSVARLLANDSHTRMRFLPNANFDGDASLRFHAWDQTSGDAGGTTNLVETGGASAFSVATALGVVDVTPVNDAPVVVVSSSATALNAVLEHSSLVWVDDDSSEADFHITLTVSAGTLLLSAVEGIQQSGNGLNSIVISGKLPALQAALTTLQYVPSFNYRGTATISVQADEVGGSTTASTAVINVGAPFSLSGHTLTVTGSAIDDVVTISFPTSSELLVTINGTSASYSTSTVNRVVIDPQAGKDTVTVTATNRNNVASFQPQTLNLVSNSGSSHVTIEATQSEQVMVFGDAGDSATLVGSSAKETFFALAATNTQSSIINLVGDGWFSEAIGFATATATGNGGNDGAIFVDSPNDDTWTASASQARLQGGGFVFEANGFAENYAFAIHGGHDQAVFNGTDGTDSLDVTGEYTMLHVAGVLNEVIGFESLTVHASGGA
ncbi:MAG: tandem-95 repeat protein, partial [Planctomycetaceae bacterium]|nr:tandem-95 repeat protein [Planctomycetaceae bacterium]